MRAYKITGDIYISDNHIEIHSESGRVFAASVTTQDVMVDMLNHQAKEAVKRGDAKVVRINEYDD